MRREVEAMAVSSWSEQLPAVQRGILALECYYIDIRLTRATNHYFNRPGQRLVDTLAFWRACCVPAPN